MHSDCSQMIRVSMSFASSSGEEEAKELNDALNKEMASSFAPNEDFVCIGPVMTGENLCLTIQYLTLFKKSSLLQTYVFGPTESEGSSCPEFPSEEPAEVKVAERQEPPSRSFNPDASELKSFRCIFLIFF